MSDIKVIEGLEPWEVMKMASEGESIAIKTRASMGWERLGAVCTNIARSFNFTEHQYAIIDTTAPEIEWDKFDWDFFNQHGGLPAAGPEQLDFDLAGLDDGAIMDTTGLRESPFYYWPGGQRPVPSNVEVEIVLRDKTQKTVEAGEYYWVCGISAPSTEIIAFKLTGKTCS